MHSLLVSLALFGQAGIPNPPTPAAVVPSPSATESVDDLRAWLLARLIVDMSFDVQKSGEVERMLNRMDERQMRALVAAYKEKSERKAQSSAVQKETSQQQSLDQAKLDLQQAVNLDILEECRRRGIRIAIPSRRVFEAPAEAAWDSAAGPEAAATPPG